MTRLIITAMFSLTACGGDGNILLPGSGDEPGTGTQTLFVEGRVSGEARLTNARTTAEFDTEFSLRILLNQVPVTTGTVTITSVTGEFPLAFTNVDGENRWRGRANGYDEVYILDIVSGSDEVRDVRVDGPDIHTFLAPVAGATVDSSMPLAIDWERADEADIASIDTNRLERLSIPDTGKYMLPAGSLEADSQEARTNDIEIERTDRVIPAGAVAGSEFSVRLRNDITVVAQPNPAL